MYSVGADFAPPPIPPSSLMLWKAIFAGGVAGVMSRTATAPMEKIKLLAQVRICRACMKVILICKI